MQLSDEAKEALLAIGDIYTTGLREAFHIPDDWRYHSSSCTLEEYKKYMDILKEENVTFVSCSLNNNVIRFSIFVSPAGVENARVWQLNNKDNVGVA